MAMAKDTMIWVVDDDPELRKMVGTYLIDKGYDVVALTPSCSLMLKFEWPLILPDDADVRRLSKATRDISEYIVDIAKNEGLADGMSALDGSVTVHLSCHSRAQNMGQKAAELLRLIPNADVQVIERCSGHGGSWGIMKDNFETGIKIGRPADVAVFERGSGAQEERDEHAEEAQGAQGARPEGA